MPTFYLDSVNGSDSNSGLSPSAPKQNYQTLSYSGGDTLLFKRGTTQNITSEFKGVTAGSASAGYTTFGVYGDSNLPYATFTKNPAIGSSSMILNMSQTSWVKFEDIFFDCTNNTYSCLVQGQAGNTVTNVIFRRCTFANSLVNGLDLRADNNNNGGCSGILVDSCRFYNNGAHGVFMHCADNCTIINSECFDNGATVITGGHGISAYPFFVTVTSGWTLTAGTVYQRAVTSLNANATDVFEVRDLNKTSGLNLVYKVAPTTSPAVGQYSVTGGNLYVNLGINPAGVSILLMWLVARNLVIEGNYCHHNIFNRAAAFTEGHGIALDDSTADSIVAFNRCEENEGFGISVNRGNNNRVFGNVIRNNGGPAIVVNPCVGMSIFNNTCVGNNTDSTIANTGEIILSDTRDAVVRNNAIVPRAGRTYGITAGTAVNLTGATNRVQTGFIAAQTGTFTNNAVGEVAAYLGTDGSLKIPSTSTLASLNVDNPLASGGTYTSGVSLMNGRLRPGFVPIGAYQPVLVRTSRS
jgi:parallel beta-helix repeat protein